MKILLNPNDQSLEIDLAGQLNRQEAELALRSLTNDQLEQLTLGLVELSHNIEALGKLLFRESLGRSVLKDLPTSGRPS